jgi:hypothetical protein
MLYYTGGPPAALFQKGIEHSLYIYLCDWGKIAEDWNVNEISSINNHWIFSEFLGFQWNAIDI